LPRIDELIDRLTGSTVFSKLDLRNGFYHIPLQPEQAHLTAFNTRYGSYEWRVMPFGLCNAPSSFQRLMNAILQDGVDDFVVVYLDDILIFSKTPEEHAKHLRWVLERLREHKLYAKPSKSWGSKTNHWVFFQNSKKLRHAKSPKDGVIQVQKKKKKQKNKRTPKCRLTASQQSLRDTSSE
jgi:hypothetical protein